MAKKSSSSTVRRPRQVCNTSLHPSQKTKCLSYERLAKKPRPHTLQQRRIIRLAKKHIGEHLEHVIKRGHCTFRDDDGVWAFKHVSSESAIHTVFSTFKNADWDYELTLSTAAEK